MHAELLAQARHLATLGEVPRQADLRRAISSAYYSLFHLLAAEAADQVLPGEDQAPLRLGLRRAITHAEIKNASRAIKDRTTLPVYGNLKVPDDLAAFAKAAFDLQEARHLPDYDPTRSYDRIQALTFVEMAEGAFEAWKRIRDHQTSRLYLTLLITYARLEKRRP